ncbi:CRISPR-associated protein Csx16 [Thiomicrospira microaerophila]|uniref:CRISPR-associated protein Csx16 n=1 Tax=Thiomicrospira microaerophila TaxID=406020 RepID=UPI0005C94B59|nr:CRISPR-associated protein Csx16 [Thiomicrospira microaerophila]
MSVYVVTRHKGALDWLVEEAFSFDQHLEHLDLSMLKSGDTIVGNLPIPMVSDMNAMGVDYWHLAFNVPFELRGVELSATQLRELGISLQPYRVEAL